MPEWRRQCSQREVIRPRGGVMTEPITMQVFSDYV
jgi:hypothetical protein